MSIEVTTTLTPPAEKSRIQLLRDIADNAETHAQDAVEAFMKHLEEAKAKGEHELVSLSLEANKHAAIHAASVVRGLALHVDSTLRFARSIAETINDTSNGELTEEVRKQSQHEAVSMLFYGLQHLLPLMWDTATPLIVEREMEVVVSVKTSVELALSQAEHVLKELGFADEPRTSFGTRTVASHS